MKALRGSSLRYESEFRMKQKVDMKNSGALAIHVDFEEVVNINYVNHSEFCILYSEFQQSKLPNHETSDPFNSSSLCGVGFAGACIIAGSASSTNRT